MCCYSHVETARPLMPVPLNGALFDCLIEACQVIGYVCGSLQVPTVLPYFLPIYFGLSLRLSWDGPLITI